MSRAGTPPHLRHNLSPVCALKPSVCPPCQLIRDLRRLGFSCRENRHRNGIRCWRNVCRSVGFGWSCSAAGAWFGWGRSVVLGLAGSVGLGWVFGESVAVVRSGMVVSFVSAPRLVDRRLPVVGRNGQCEDGWRWSNILVERWCRRKEEGSEFWGGRGVCIPFWGLKTFWKVGQQHCLQKYPGAKPQVNGTAYCEFVPWWGLGEDQVN